MLLLTFQTGECRATSSNICVVIILTGDFRLRIAKTNQKTLNITFKKSYNGEIVSWFIPFQVEMKTCLGLNRSRGLL